MVVCCRQYHARSRATHGAISRYLYCTAYRPCWFDALPDTWCSGGQLLGVAYTSGVTAKYSEQRSTVPHRCTDAFCPRNNGGSKQRSQQAAAPLTRSHRASTPRCGAPCPRGRTWAHGTLGQAAPGLLGVARRAGEPGAYFKPPWTPWELPCPMSAAYSQSRSARICAQRQTKTSQSREERSRADRRARYLFGAALPFRPPRLHPARLQVKARRRPR